MTFSLLIVSSSSLHSFPSSVFSSNCFKIKFMIRDLCSSTDFKMSPSLVFLVIAVFIFVADFKVVCFAIKNIFLPYC